MWERIIVSLSIIVSQDLNDLWMYLGFWTADSPNKKFDQSTSSSTQWALVFIWWKGWHRERLVHVHDALNR